jgi:homoserine kinase
MTSGVRVFAPASASNLGPGFDILGLALAAPGDVVEAEWSDRPGVELAQVTGDGGALSLDPLVNVAGVAALHVWNRLKHLGGRGAGVRIRLEKRMPMASGLGSSAASKAAE